MGLNKKGSLGIKTKELEVGNLLKVELPSKIIKIDAGTDFSYVLSEDGKLYAWGSNYFG
jgi:alpha-tubulin suppressor-like RCC1 family protein